MAEVAAGSVPPPVEPTSGENAPSRGPSTARTAQHARNLERSDLEYEQVCQAAAEALERNSVLLQHAVANCETPTATRIRMLRYLIGKAHVAAENVPAELAEPETKEISQEGGCES